jgi:predicted ABC-type ATPase
VPAAHPSVVVLSGPNGAGKSTTATRLLVGSLQVSEYVDADVFARTLPRSEATAITAGRGVLRRLDELATERRSFGFETTLASRSFGPRIRRLIGAGYECHLVFLWLPSADLAVQELPIECVSGATRYRRQQFGVDIARGCETSLGSTRL